MMDRAQFAWALADGRGSAAMFVIDHGLAGVEDLVLQACLERQAQDRQCEGDRAAWLYPMFKDTPARARFATALVAALDVDDESYDGHQIETLLALMALDGELAAGEALRNFVWGQTDIAAGIAGAQAIVTLDGMPALIELARRFGRNLMHSPDDYVDTLAYLTGEDARADLALAELRRRAPADEEIAAYVAQELKRRDELAYVAPSDEQRALNRQKYQDKVRQEWPLERIFAVAAEKEPIGRGRFTNFARHAGDDLLNAILDRFAAETDIETCRRLLWIFRTAALPRMDERIWAMAQDSTSALRGEAMIALSFLRDERIGVLGREVLRDDGFSSADVAAIELLALNYQPGDDALILGALAKLNLNRDEAHDFGYAIDEICQENETPALAAWDFHNNPCTICRERAFERLQDLNAVSEEIANEYLHDARHKSR